MQKKEGIITNIIIPRDVSVLLSLLLIFGFFLITIRYGGVLRYDQILFSGIIFLIFSLLLPFIPSYFFKDRFFFLTLIFLLFSSISLFRAVDIRSAFLNIILILDFLFVFLLTKFLSAERRIREILTTGIVSSASVLVGFYLLTKPLPMKGNFANPAHFSILLSSSVPLVLFSRNSGKSILPWIPSFILIVGTLLTGAWGGITSLFIALLVYIFINRSQLGGKKWILYFSFFLFLVFLSIFSVYEGVGGSFYIKGLISSISSRLEMWYYGIKCFLKFLPFGIGIGSFRWLFPSCYKGDMRGEFPALHNEYLEALLSLGIFPFFIILYGILFLFRSYISFSYHNKTLLGTRTGAFVSLLVILVHSFFDFPMHIPLLLFLSASLMGIFQGEKILLKENMQKSRIPFSLLLLLFSTIFVFAWRDYMKINKSIKEEKVIETGALYSPFLDSLAIERVGEAYYERFKKTGNESLLYSAFILFERCVEMNRMNYRCFYNLGVISFQMGDRDSAKDYLRTSIRINPLNPMAKFLIGAIIFEEDEEEGRRLIDDSVKVAPQLMKEAEKLLNRE